MFCRQQTQGRNRCTEERFSLHWTPVERRDRHFKKCDNSTEFISAENRQGNQSNFLDSFSSDVRYFRCFWRQSYWRQEVDGRHVCALVSLVQLWEVRVHKLHSTEATLRPILKCETVEFSNPLASNIMEFQTEWKFKMFIQLNLLSFGGQQIG